MSEFVKLLAAFISGGILTPYFSHFLTIKKTKRELNLKYLEEAYELVKQLKTYAAQTPRTIIFLISFQEYKMDMNTFPKSVESPISRLSTLLDYHLDAPQNLIQCMENLNTEILGAFRPIAEAINDPNNKSQFFTNAISLAIDAAQKALVVTEELILWIKDINQ